MGLKKSYVELLFNLLLTYTITRQNIGGKKMPWIVFALQMGHLTVNHLVRAFGNIPLTTIEITAMQMVLCMNLTSYAWSVHDGKNRKEEDCDAQQKNDRVSDEPSLLEFLGYA
jgi:lysophospholipid acyltransferase